MPASRSCAIDQFTKTHLFSTMFRSITELGALPDGLLPVFQRPVKIQIQTPLKEVHDHGSRIPKIWKTGHGQDGCIL